MLRRIFSLTAANLLAQGIVFLSTPFVSRYYSPFDLGEFHWAMSIATLFSIVLSLQLSQRVPSINIDDLAAFRNKANSIIFINHAAAYFLLFFSFLIGLVDGDALGYLILSHLLSVNGFNSICNIVLSETKIFFISVVSRSILLISFQVAFGLWYPIGSDGLILSCIFSELFCWYLVRYNDLRKARHFTAKVRGIFDKEVFDYARYVTLGAVFSYLVNFFPAFIMKLSGDMQGLGYFAMCYKLLGIPLYAFSNSARPIYIKWLIHKSDIKRIHFSFVVFFVLFLLFLSAFIAWVVPANFYSLILGKNWIGIEKYFAITLVWIGLSFVNTFNQEVLRYNNKLKFIFYNELVNAAFKVLPLLIISVNDIAYTFIMFAIIGTFLTLLLNMREIANCLEK